VATLNAAQIESGAFSSNADSAATALPESTSSSSSNNGGGGGGLSKGAIAGIVIGSVLGALKLAFLFWFCCWRRRSRGGHTMAQEYGIRKGDGVAGGMRPWNTRHSSDDGASPIFNEKQKNSQDDIGTPNSQFVSGRLRGGRTSLESSTYTSSSGEARNLVSSYRDHYSHKNIVPGTVVTAIYTYNANLPDELHLEPEDQVTINKIFDDGWASGTMNDGNGGESQGFFPLVTVTLAGDDQSGYDGASSVSAFTARTSSARGGGVAKASTAGSQAGDANIHDPQVHNAK